MALDMVWRRSRSPRLREWRFTDLSRWPSARPLSGIHPIEPSSAGSSTFGVSNEKKSCTRSKRDIGIVVGKCSSRRPVTVQLKWVAQAQFAGYFVAKEKGFYKDAGSTSRSSQAAPMWRLPR